MPCIGNIYFSFAAAPLILEMEEGTHQAVQETGWDPNQESEGVMMFGYSPAVSQALLAPAAVHADLITALVMLGAVAVFALGVYVGSQDTRTSHSTSAKKSA